MLDLLDFDRLEEILVLIIPGFVSLKVWTLINPTARLKLADYLLDIIAFSALNFAALSWLLAITTDSPLWLRIIVGIGVFIGAPAAWPVLLRATLNWRVLRGRIIHPDPLAWDYFFRQGHSCFVLVHLKDGKVIGGLYNGESFASSYPESQDIYLGEVWKVDEQGRFQSRIDATMGALVNHAVIDYLEFYAAGGSSSEASEEHTKAESR